MNNIGMAFALSGLLCPLFLGLGGMLNIAPGLRFKLSAALVIITWCVMHQFLFDWVCLAGLLCISAALLIAFMFWSVLCWGYTLSMLLCLEEKNMQNLQQWERQYAGEQGLQTLSKNRINVLVGLRFASVVENNVILTKLGSVSAIGLRWVSRFFGIIP